MKAFTALMLFLVAGSIFCGQNKSDGARQIVLPRPDVMHCATAGLWVTQKIGTRAVYPVQLAIDHFDKNGCPQAMLALYDKSISEDEIKASIDRLYGKWARADNDKPPLKLWRVESEQFAIQLATIEDSVKETGSVGQKGMKQVIYLSFSISK